MANPNPQVTVKQTGPKKYTLDDTRFTKPHPELYEKFKDHPKMVYLLSLAKTRAECANEATQDMGILDKEVKSTWPSNVEVARRRTLGRRRTMTEEELAIWEASRNPSNGVPPSDVEGSLDGGWSVEN